MSAIVVLKEHDTLVLGTDSRFLKHDFSGVDSDQVRKIFDIAPGAFIATSGWKMACDFQPEKARELAGRLGTTDIKIIAEALERPRHGRPAVRDVGADEREVLLFVVDRGRGIGSHGLAHFFLMDLL
jgi:hypothetical protein